MKGPQQAPSKHPARIPARIPASIPASIPARLPPSTQQAPGTHPASTLHTPGKLDPLDALGPRPAALNPPRPSPWDSLDLHGPLISLRRARRGCAGCRPRPRRSHQQAPSKHPASTQQAPSKHPAGAQQAPSKHPASTQQPPSKHPASTQQAPSKHPANTQQLHSKHPASIPARTSASTPPSTLQAPWRHRDFWFRV